MRKIIAVTLALLLMLALAGCSKNEPTSATTEKETSTTESVDTVEEEEEASAETEDTDASTASEESDDASDSGLLSPEFKKTMWVVASETNGVKTLVAATNAVTVRMAMNHTSGLPFELPCHAACGWNHRLPLRNAAAEAAAVPLLFQPGTAVKYSNIGIDVGAAVVQQIVGRPWEEYL